MFRQTVSVTDSAGRHKVGDHTDNILIGLLIGLFAAFGVQKSSVFTVVWK